MTWIKSHSSTIQIDLTQAIHADTNWHEAIEEVLDWVEGRGWTIERDPARVNSHTTRAYMATKTVTTRDGQTMILDHGIGFTTDLSSDQVSIYVFNGNVRTYTEVKADSVNGSSFYHSSAFDYTQGSFEIWTSDLDNESFLLLFVDDQNDRYICWYEPPAGSHMNMVQTGTATKACVEAVFVPFGVDNLCKISTTNAGWRPSAQLASEYFGSNSEDFIVHGISQKIGLSSSPSGSRTISFELQTDVSTRYNPTTNSNNPLTSSQISSVKVGNTFYIGLGLSSRQSQCLLDVGSTNPAFN